MVHLAGCIIRNPQGGILLLHRTTPGRVQWELPGGKIEGDESPPEAARREVFEELGITLTNVKRFGEDSFIEDGHEFHYHWFTAEIAGGPSSGSGRSADRIPQPLEDKFDEARYLPLAELESLPLSANMCQLLPHLARGAA